MRKQEGDETDSLFRGERIILYSKQEEREESMKAKKVLLLLAIGCLSVSFIAMPGVAQGKKVVLKAVAAWPTHIPQNYWFHEFIKVFNERAQKEGVPVSINKLGGPEVVGTRDQFNGMRSGIVDMVYTCGDYFTGETIELSAISCIRPDPLYFLNTLNETNVMEAVNEASREKSGVLALFPVLMGRGFTLLSTKPINPGDWAGLKIRSIGGLTALGIPGMGASAMLVPAAEVFEALQRGTVDGVIGSASDRYGFGERGIYKYILMPRYFFSATYWFISARAWDKLTNSIKTFVIKVSKEIEERSFPWCRRWDDETVIKYMNEDKVKLVWSSPEAEKKIAKAFRGDYLDLIVKKSPKHGSKIYNLIKDYVY